MISFFEEDALVVAVAPPALPPHNHPLPPPSFLHAPELLLLAPASDAPPQSFFAAPRAEPQSLASASVALPGSLAALLSPAQPPAPRMPMQLPPAPTLPPRAGTAPPGPDPFAALMPVTVVAAPAAPPATPMRPLLGAASPAPRDAFADLGVL